MLLADILLISFVGLWAALGLLRGIVKESLGLIRWVAIIFVCFKGGPLVEHYLQAYFSQPLVCKVIAYVSIFLISVVVFSYIQQELNSFIYHINLGFINRIMGCVFGVVKGVTLLGLMNIGLMMFESPEKYPAMLQESRYMHYVFTTSNFLLDNILPARTRLFLESNSKQGSAINRDKKSSDASDSNSAAPNLASPSIVASPDDLSNPDRQKEVSDLAELKPTLDQQKAKQEDTSSQPQDNDLQNMYQQLHNNISQQPHSNSAANN